MSNLYKKIANRPLSLMTIQPWYLSDSFAMEKISEGRMNFKPLFYHEDGFGVSVYYDFTDPKQDPRNLLPYFYDQYEKLLRLIAEYEIDCAEIEKLIAKGSKENFEDIYKLIVKTWPILAICDVVGRMEAEEKYKKIIAKCYETRIKYDTIVYKADEFLLNVIKKSFLDNELANFIFPEEFIENKIPSSEILHARKKKFIYFDGEIDTVSDIQEFCMKRDVDIESAYNSGKKILQGSIAHKGIAKGKVKLIFEISQMGKIEEGDILVTSMTTPSILPAMKKAAAFVTDEGGITCHAAIVAREMGKPCIIGTKIATQVLRDGDIVEVDADNGVVKILNG